MANNIQSHELHFKKSSYTICLLYTSIRYWPSPVIRVLSGNLAACAQSVVSFKERTPTSILRRREKNLQGLLPLTEGRLPLSRTLTNFFLCMAARDPQIGAAYIMTGSRYGPTIISSNFLVIAELARSDNKRIGQARWHAP